MQSTVAMIMTYNATVCGCWGQHFLGDRCNRLRLPLLTCSIVGVIASSDFSQWAVGEKAKLQILTPRID